MVTINLSTGKDYHSQRNNKIDPHGACGPTSLVMALLYSGYTLPGCQGRQPEDVLIEFLRENKIIDLYYKKNYPREHRQKVPANEIPMVREFGINLWMGKRVSNFTFGARMNDIAYSLIKGKACAVSGLWPYKSGDVIKSIGHIVCVCGFQTAQENIEKINSPFNIDCNKIISFIVDDPYGDYRTNYTDIRGNDVIVPYRDFFRIVKENGQNRKWTHFIL